MCTDILTLGYIDPNTSQHVFSLLGPLLASLAALGGLIVAGLVFVRRGIASYFAGASWMKRAAAVSAVVGVLAILAAGIWWLAG